MGAERVCKDLTLDRGVTVGLNRAEKLMRENQIRSVTVRITGSGKRAGPAVHDGLVGRVFVAAAPNQLWLTDITEHPTACIPAIVATPTARSGYACEEVPGMPARKYTEQQRLEFMTLIDRGGSVRAAAVASGAHPDRGYQWMKQAGLSTPRSTQRKYTAAEKAEFFKRLAEVGNVSAVARELGLNRVSCYVWAPKAGIFMAAYSDAKRQEFLRLRREGVSRREAAGRLGIEAHQALDWDNGIRVFSKGRIYPDGRIVLYRPAEIRANVKNPRTAWVQGERVALARVEQIIDPRYLSLLERERSKDLQSSGLSIRRIATSMGRSPSTISRELRRNTVSRHGYLPHNARRTSAKRRERPRASKLAAEGPLHDYVAAKLAERWSPEQISHRLRRDFPHDEEMRVGGETIYQAVCVHLHGELKREFVRAFRRGRSARKS